MEKEGPSFKSLKDTLPFVKEYVCATRFEQECIRERFHGEWIDLQTKLGCEIGKDKTYVEFTFAMVGKRLIAFYNTTSRRVNWDDVDGFIRSYGVRKTDARLF